MEGETFTEQVARLWDRWLDEEFLRAFEEFLRNARLPE